MLKYKRVEAASLPKKLLLEADPSESNINEYLSGSLCFAAYEDELIVGVCVTKSVSKFASEIYNISVSQSVQKRGIGSRLLEYVITQLSDRGMKEIVLGTGTFGHQLTFYQRLGFRVDSIIKDFFIDNYDEPIFENGLQHFDMLRLTLKLEK